MLTKCELGVNFSKEDGKKAIEGKTPITEQVPPDRIFVKCAIQWGITTDSEPFCQIRNPCTSLKIWVLNPCEIRIREQKPAVGFPTAGILPMLSG